MKQIKIFLSHPNFGNSVINKHLAESTKKNPQISVFHLDKMMFKGFFNLEEQKKILQNADAIVWQFPIYWYNCPPSLREWQDQVMSPLVYSANNLLKGMPIRIVFTAGAGIEQYSHNGLNHYTAEEMLRPFEMTANAAGMEWKKPLGFFSCGQEMGIEDLKKAEKAYLQSMDTLF